MIAYNHYIKFIPELENDKKIKSTYEDVIIVKECIPHNIDDKLAYEMTFFNNQGRDISLNTDREITRTVKGQPWTFEVKSVVIFHWYSGTGTLCYIKGENFTEALLEYWALHIIIPVYLTTEEKYDFLHAGAVEVGDKPVLFVAESCGGKSTMTDFFLNQGHTMISDDKVATYEENGKFFAVPSHPHHRPYRAMEDLGYFIENVASSPKPIHAIYELQRFSADIDISIVELNGIEKFTSLSYASEMKLSFLKTKRFTFLGEMAKVVPVYRVMVPWDIERLSEVYIAICHHSEGLI